MDMKPLIYIAILTILAAGGWWFVLSGTSSPSTDESSVLEAVTYEETFEEEPDLSLSRTIEVYDGISVPVDVRVLNLAGKGLDGSLKAEIRILTNLRTLDISNNNFTGLPAEVGQLSQLEVLNLAHNPLTGLPYEIGNLQKLKTLDLRGTDYAKADLEVIKTSLPETVNILIK